MCKIISTFLVTLALWAMAGMPAASARGGSDWRECNGRDVDARIAACTRILDQAGRSNSTMRAGAFNSRASAYFGKGEFERAARDLDEAIAAKPNKPVLYYNRGLVLANKGDNELALRSFDEAIGLNPRYASAYNDRANLFFRQKEYDRAISGYDDAIRFDPRNSTLYGNRGNAYRQKGDYDRAIRDFDEAVRLDPRESAAIYGRSQVYSSKGDYARALPISTRRSDCAPIRPTTSIPAASSTSCRATMTAPSATSTRRSS